jgi:hypothetical protein
MEATGMAILGMAVGHVLLRLAEAHDRARAARARGPIVTWWLR